MKKVFLLIIISLTSISHSQIVNDFGMKIGGTLSYQDWDYSFNTDFSPDNKLGFNIGVFVESSDISIFKFVGELNFVQKGAEKEAVVRTTENPDGTGETKLWQLGLNYFNLSILAKPNINLGSFNPYLLIGPKIDLELSKSTESDGSFYDDFNKSRIGVKLGIGSEINVFDFRLLAEFVYDTDFSNLYKNDNLEITTYSYVLRFGVYL